MKFDNIANKKFNNCIACYSLTADIALLFNILMNNNFLPISRNVFPTFQTYCPVGVQVDQTVVHFAHFQVQARKRVFLGGV